MFDKAICAHVYTETLNVVGTCLIDEYISVHLWACGNEFLGNDSCAKEGRFG